MMRVGEAERERDRNREWGGSVHEADRRRAKLPPGGRSRPEMTNGAERTGQRPCQACQACPVRSLAVCVREVAGRSARREWASGSAWAIHR